MPNPAISPKTCFLVDDDIDDQEIFMAAVNEVDNSIKCVGIDNCEEAIETLKCTGQNPPDFIFLDLNMPVKNGFQCLEEIKNTKRWNNVKVVILSTSSHPEQIKTAYDLGADLYLTKSTSYSEFRNTLTNCLQLDLTDLR